MWRQKRGQQLYTRYDCALLASVRTFGCTLLVQENDGYRLSERIRTVAAPQPSSIATDPFIDTKKDTSD